MDRFFCKISDGKWEEVSQFVFENRKNVIIKDDGKPRYCDSAISQIGNQVTITGPMTTDELGKMCRYMSVVVPCGAYVPIVTEPEYVMMKNRGGTIIMHHVESGEDFKSQRKVAA